MPRGGVHGAGNLGVEEDEDEEDEEEEDGRGKGFYFLRECQPSPTLSPTDPVPGGLLTLCPGARVICMSVCKGVSLLAHACV